MRQADAVVTCASQGIGHSTAVRLARDFSSVVLVARNRAKLELSSFSVGNRPDGCVGYHGRPMTESGVFGYLAALS